MLLFSERSAWARWIEAEAELLIQRLGIGAFATARRMDREASDFPSLRYWRSVRKAIARETKIETYRISDSPTASP